MSAQSSFTLSSIAITSSRRQRQSLSLVSSLLASWVPPPPFLPASVPAEQDVNNVAQPLMLKDALAHSYLPALTKLIGALRAQARPRQHHRLSIFIFLCLSFSLARTIARAPFNGHRLICLLVALSASVADEELTLKPLTLGLR